MGTAGITDLLCDKLPIAMGAIKPGDLMVRDLNVRLMIVTTVNGTQSYDSTLIGDLNVQLDARQIMLHMFMIHQRTMAVWTFDAKRYDLIHGSGIL
jgi:hypothetical protein